MPQSSAGEWLTAEEVAEELRIPRQQVYKLARESDLPATRIGGRTLRFRRADFDAWLEARKNISQTSDTSEGG